MPSFNMNYREVLERLFSKRPLIPSPKIEGVREVAQLLGNPQNSYPTIHITGTNGKGSVALKIAKTLELSGYKVGLFTSPHLVSFTERITINGVSIPEEQVCQGLLRLFELGEELGFFELVTLLAYNYFQQAKVDVAVIEVGIGGLLDATNIITPLLSVITSIDFDHENILGDTCEKIAEQKAGIIKPGVPVVVGPTADFEVIRKRADQLFKVEPKPGFYDFENTAIAQQALEILKSKFSLTHIEEGLKVRPPCRFEQIGRVILDVAHNPAGITRLLEALPPKPFSVIVGMSKDKDLHKCLALLAARAEHLYLVPSPAPKAATPEEMAQILTEIGQTHFTLGSMREALALNELRPERGILICGSFYIMQEAREEILRIKVAHQESFLNTV